MRGYISGPMTGHDDWNVPAFDAAAARVRGWGFQAVNPADNFGRDYDVPGGWPVYLRHDVSLVCSCSVLFALPGWEASRGSRWEVAVAAVLGMPILDAETCRALDPQPEPVLGFRS